MAFSISNFNAFQETAGEFTSTLDRELNALATIIATEMRSDAPVANGDLRNSIKINIDKYKFILEMLAYGPYQNYGVEGTQNRSTVAEDEMTGSRHRFGTQFSMTGGNLPFGARVNIHRYGLNRQPFYSVENIIGRMAETILSNDTLE
jgi:hypothetical protein